MKKEGEQVNVRFMSISIIDQLFMDVGKTAEMKLGKTAL